MNIIIFLISTNHFVFELICLAPMKIFSHPSHLLLPPSIFSMVVTFSNAFVNFKRPAAFNYHYICLLYNIINWCSTPNSQFCIILSIFLHENMGQLVLRLKKSIIYISFSFIFPNFKNWSLIYTSERAQTHKGNFWLRFQTGYYHIVRQVEFFPDCDCVPAKGMLPRGNATSPNSLIHPFFRHISIWMTLKNPFLRMETRWTFEIWVGSKI